MHRLLLCCIIMTISFELFSQEKMIVKDSYPGSTFYDGFSKHVISLEELPPQITLNLKGSLSKYFGELRHNIIFEDGQKVDLKKYFLKNKEVFNMRWIVPKYDLNFSLGDSSLGLVKYNINARLDEYGQIIQINWPKKNHNVRTNFLDRKEIEQFALKYAKKKGLETDSYSVNLKYNLEVDKLCWVFRFPLAPNQYNTFEIAWVGNLEVLTEYESRFIVVN